MMPLLDECKPRLDFPHEIHGAGWPSSVPMLLLTTRPGTPQQKTWRLRRAVTVIGSRSTAHIMLRHDAVSKTHAAVICDGTDPVICDLASRNGTFLRGQRIRSERLREGDGLRIGPYDVRVHTQLLPGSRGRNFESGQFQAVVPSPELRLLDGKGNAVVSARENVIVVGMRENVDLAVESDDPVPAMAMLIPWRRGWAVYDLAFDDEPRTQVNEQRVYSASLHRGDRLSFSREALQVVFDGNGSLDMDATASFSGGKSGDMSRPRHGSVSGAQRPCQE